jgi:hypothetical protein
VCDEIQYCFIAVLFYCWLLNSYCWTSRKLFLLGRLPTGGGDGLSVHTPAGLKPMSLS